jgi:hypothetical protein
MRHRLNQFLNSVNLQHAPIRWRVANPTLRTLVIAIATAGVVLGIFGVLNAIGTINATAASILVAVVFGISTIFQQRQSQRRQYTVDLLTEFVSSDRVSSAAAWLADRRINSRPVTEKVSAQERGQVSAALDYYELIASLALRGQVDVPMVLEIIGSSLIRNFEVCRPYVDHRRATDAPYIYSDIEVFLRDYRQYEHRWQLQRVRDSFNRHVP